jgi:hypothetical protein
VLGVDTKSLILTGQLRQGIIKAPQGSVPKRISTRSLLLSEKLKYVSRKKYLVKILD